MLLFFHLKTLEFQGGKPKIEEKTWFSRGVNAKKWKTPGGHGKFDWKSRRVNFKKSDILNKGILYLKTTFIHTLRRLMNSDRTCEPG